MTVRRVLSVGIGYCVGLVIGALSFWQGLHLGDTWGATFVVVLGGLLGWVGWGLVIWVAYKLAEEA